jgi:hypothetical protein
MNNRSVDHSFRIRESFPSPQSLPRFRRPTFARRRANWAGIDNSPIAGRITFNRLPRAVRKLFAINRIRKVLPPFSQG